MCCVPEYLCLASLSIQTWYAHCTKFGNYVAAMDGDSSETSEANDEGEDWDNQDACDLDAEAYLQDLAARPELHQTSQDDAAVHEEEDYAETIEQVSTLKRVSRYTTPGVVAC